MSTRNGTVAERPTFFRRTSDDHGSYIKMDTDSCLTLVRQKIQEKCNTTQDLINLIRRNKVSNGQKITPGEFRVTLCKFNIMFPQSLVDKIFSIFDSDRSGTMDFDEFAMWIMNSEFKPSNPHSQKLTNDSPNIWLRKKLLKCTQANSHTLNQMKRKVSFAELIYIFSRMQERCGFTDSDVRAVFLMLDKEDNGLIEMNELLKFAYAENSNGTQSHELSLTMNSSSAKVFESKQSINDNEIRKILSQIIGFKTRKFTSAFSHIEIDKGVKLSFEEFRRCLLNAGVEKNLHDIRKVFIILGGDKNGFADVDLLFRNLSSEVEDPYSEVYQKPLVSTNISSSRADRRLRENLRKTFAIVKQTIVKADKMTSGFVALSVLHQILEKYCMPISYEDLRFVLQNINKHPNNIDYIDYKHFLRAYDPVGSAHEFLNMSTIRRSGESILRLKA